MPKCLIALGSNLGDRAVQLERAIDGLSHLPQTQLLARSSWHETCPIGGPTGQGAFLNGAALISTSLAPMPLLAEMRRIEAALGRERSERWAARHLDLDLLLCDDLRLHTPEIEVPHPRMAFRRFVLEPAAEVAPWMVHGESGWTIERLLELLNRGENHVAVAATDERAASDFALRLSDRLPTNSPDVRAWDPASAGHTNCRPKLIVGLRPSDGMDSPQLRTMLHLPKDGPIAWSESASDIDPLSEAVAAIDSVWPDIAAQDVLTK